MARSVCLDRYTAPNENFVPVARRGEEPYSGPRRAERAKKTLANQPRAFTFLLSRLRGYQGRSPWLVLVAVSVGTAAMVVPAWAHHSFAAAYDADQPVMVRGVIVDAKLANPHSRIVLDVTDAAGTVTRWGFEAQTPTALIRSGVRPEVFKIGSQVTIRGVHARDMTRNEGAAREIVLADGRSYIIGPKGNEPDRDQ